MVNKYVSDVNQSGTIDRKDFELAIEVCKNKTKYI